ncbi:hypothetical protein [Lysinibacter cavernae]|uniref:Beta/gamma crystallin 'Greek key' domain-containing protein n=1 Tax=Lysinibacter cavernae TaxID=1640652 RepID=A0A7X5R2I9_9MICO|nr:hypothetical protein [Lysinibacter cavernae]NIH54409.1 hypothetical protein [Lysinibacter cavernae]
MQQSSTLQNVRVVVMLVMAASLALFGASVAPQQAADAAGPATFTVSLAADAPSATTGTASNFTITYSCSGTVPCEGAVISLPLPQYVTAQMPGWGFSWWAAPVLTNSADVAVSATGSDGVVTFTMNGGLAVGTTGTLGVRYTSNSLTTPNGSQLLVTANANGSNADPSTSSASMQLTAPTQTAVLQSSVYGVVYLDQDVTIHHFLGAASPYAIGVEGVASVATFQQDLPAGAEFVSSIPMPDSIVGNQLTWNNLPDAGNTYEPGQRKLDVVVRFPSAAFSDGQTVTPVASAAGTMVGGGAFTVSRPATVNLKTFVEHLEPYLQVTTSNYAYVDNAVPRGGEYGFNYYLNNYNSTVPSVSAILSTDVAPGFNFTTMYAAAGNTVSWVTALGAVGSKVLTENTLLAADLQLEPGDRVTHFDVELGAVAAPSSAGFQLNGTTTDESVNVVQQCGSLLMTSASGAQATASGCGQYRVVDPFLYPTVYLSPPSSSEAFRPGSTVTWATSAFNQNVGNLEWQPVLYFIAPIGTRVASTPTSPPSGWCQPDDAHKNPTVDVQRGAFHGQDVVVVSWPDADPLTPSSNLCGPDINTVVTTAPPGTITANLYGGSASGPIPLGPLVGVPLDSDASQPWAQLVRDDRGIVPGGTDSSFLARSLASVPTGTGASLTTNLGVQGSFDSDYVHPPAVGSAAPGTPFSYQLPISNTGNVGLRDVVLYDILPYQGDTGVSAALAGVSRESQFTPTLLGEVTPPAGFTVFYSSSTNPCRPEVNPNATGCDDDWTESPADIASVRSLKFVQDAGATLLPGAESRTTWSMFIDPNIAGDQIAVNTAAYSATRVDTGATLNNETSPVAIRVVESDLRVTIIGGERVAQTTTPLVVAAVNDGMSQSAATVSVSLSEGFALGLEPAADSRWGCTVADDALSAECGSGGLLDVGVEYRLPLTVTVPNAGATATVTAGITGPFPDPNEANNNAEAVITVVEVPPTPPVTPTPPVPTPTNGGGTTGSNGGSAGQLVLTGSGDGLYWIVGAAFVGLGWLLLLRRRRNFRP